MYLNKKFSFITFYNLLFISYIHEKAHSLLDVETDKVIRTMEREENLKENSVKNLCRYAHRLTVAMVYRFFFLFRLVLVTVYLVN